MPFRMMQKLLALVITVALVGCGVFGPPEAKIADVKSDPSTYSGKEIRVHGTVTNAIKIPFVATKIYSVQDDTGEINVVTEGAVPVPGAEVEVTGMLDTIATVGTQSVGLHLRESRR